MIDLEKIIDDPTQYGSKGHEWAPEFVAYMVAIVTHPNYEGMPDAIKDDGKIQWEAPSNRASGQFQFTHNKRRDWWKNKAKSIEIDTSKDQWISQTAKKIHPTGEKPCKRCGKVMQIRYMYPKTNLILRFKKLFGETFEISTFETITTILQRAYDLHGIQLTQNINTLLSSKNLFIPDFKNNFEALLSWIVDEYIPKEPSTLSPGVMSNAPDRFDGFHSFNRCCRGKADTGRHISNLRSYTTDRRVFEFWSEGDWIAADRLMGLVKSKLRDEICADGGYGPPSADHIGPLSLGFCHRPEFKLLSKTANSSKNNRMSYNDIQYLRNCETQGNKITSWYAQPLWDLRKLYIDNNEKALRLSKMLRDNQRNAMRILCKIFEEKKFAFLVYLLELSYADRKVDFKNLRARDFLTSYDSIVETPRTTKYSIEQKARRIRVGFDALRNYKEKENRHSFIVAEDRVNILLKDAINSLQNTSKEINCLDNELFYILFPSNGVISEEALRNFTCKFPKGKIEIFELVKRILTSAMQEIAHDINAMWDHERYVRGEFEF
ncbi:Alw26I/Eco31I/Esp3I family type II restriction endonuclease [Legionella pneumophila serogroup 1]